MYIMRDWAVNSKPWFLAAKFREAAEVLKEELIQLPADAEIEEDDTLFPPICLARLNRGRNGVAAAPQGRPRRNRIVRVRRCGNCNEPGHKRSKCRFNSVWFDWNDENDYPFQEVYRRSIPREPSELIPVLLFLSTRALPKWPKMDEKRP